ncbi:HAMP domain-containing sensor histidine kinase [Streptomyces sp. NPDC001795]|uniref:sensor histidine kinase n=1 Tax=unclassified Streptomyces TaxID=2593676 RepID=UPI00332EC8C1
MPTDAGAAPCRRKDRAPRSGPALKSLSRRLTWGLLVITTIGVLGADIYCVLTLSTRLQERTDQQIVQSHRWWLEALSQGHGLVPATDGSAAVVTDDRGTVRLSTGLTSLTRRLPLSANELRERAGAGHPTAVVDGPVRTMVGRLPDGNYLVTARSTASDQATVRTLMGIEAAISIPLIALLALGALWCSRRALVPIRDMSRSARRIAESSDQPSERVLVATQPLRELQCTADTYNYLLRRIEEGAVRRKQAERRLHDLVGAASHELRTPLTTITGYAQLARIGALDDPRRLDHALEQVQRETRRMTCLVEDLLLLARLGHGGILEQRPVDLAPLCVQAVAEAQLPGARRALRCVVESPSHVVQGDRCRLEQVIGNLLSNVLVHTPEDAPAEVRLRLDGDRHVIDVIDEGPGVPETVRERIFEPFFRAETGAPTGQDTDPRLGRGLGLSVAAAVVRAHGGSIGLEPSERGAWFHITLPALDGRRRLDSTAQAAVS